jgi:hypothetical protein
VNAACVGALAGRICDVKIIIENAETLEFLTSDGRWSKDVTRAAAFPNSNAAKARGVTFPIGRFNVVGAFATSPQLTNLDEGFGSHKGAQ